MSWLMRREMAQLRTIFVPNKYIGLVDHDCASCGPSSDCQTTLRDSFRDSDCNLGHQTGRGTRRHERNQTSTCWIDAIGTVNTQLVSGKPNIRLMCPDISNSIGGICTRCLSIAANAASASPLPDSR